MAVFALSLICLAAGSTLAVTAPKRPVRQAPMEAAGGCLIVLGLCCIGAGLPMLR